MLQPATSRARSAWLLNLNKVKSCWGIAQLRSVLALRDRWQPCLLLRVLLDTLGFEAGLIFLRPPSNLQGHRWGLKARKHFYYTIITLPVHRLSVFSPKDPSESFSEEKCETG